MFLSIVRRESCVFWCLVTACVLGCPLVANAQSLLISEFRVRGPNGANDEFVEIYNNSNADHTVASISGAGYGVAASNGVNRCIIPNGTIIPARGHYLCLNSVGYSLASYPAGNGTTATGDATYTTDIPDNAGIALFNNSTGGASYSLANRFDAVGSTSEANALYKEGSGYPALTPFSINYSFARRVPGGCLGGGCTGPGPTSSNLVDTGSNAADFVFVDTNGTSAGAGQRLGAPGPENLSSPVSRDGSALAASRLDPCERVDLPPNKVRDFTSDPANNSTFGTLDIRRTFTNTTGVPLTRLRFRILDITTFPSPSGVSDLRPRTSTSVVVTVDRVPCGVGTGNVTVQGTTLEQPPSQPNGSGFNGTLSVGAVTAGTPLAVGASVDVRFLMGIQQTGTGRFCVAAETLPASSSPIVCAITSTEGPGTFSPVVTSDFNGDRATDIAVYRPAAGMWFVRNQSSAQWGVPGDIPVAGDFSGDGNTDRAVYRPSTGTWLVQGLAPMPWGSPGDIPVPGDYDGVGTTTIGIYRPSNGTWYVPGLAPVELGIGGDIPVPGDYNGNGTTDRAVYRPSAGTWFVQGQAAVGWGIAGDIPVPGDYNGNGATDIAVYRPSIGTWFVQGQGSVQFGIPGDIPVPGDYDGNGTADIAVYRPSAGVWFVQGQGLVQFGVPGDIPLPRKETFGDIDGDGTTGVGGYAADFDGNGTTDVTVYRPADGSWWVQGQLVLKWGDPDDIPVPGDYLGDGTADLAVFRPSTGTWFVRGQTPIGWGIAGDVPVPGDYNGNGTTEIAVYRPSNGAWFVPGLSPVVWGIPGDIPVPADYNGDGTTDIAVFRPSDGTWFVRGVATVGWGIPGDVPVPGDYNGDGAAEIGVYRPADGSWFVAGQAPAQWGIPGDIPVPGDYNGDGVTQIGVYRPAEGRWYVAGQAPVQWGLLGDIPAAPVYVPR